MRSPPLGIFPLISPCQEKIQIQQLSVRYDFQWVAVVAVAVFVIIVWREQLMLYRNLFPFRSFQFRI